MNELQIRLSADISALTSALNKAKATIKSFESDTAKESERGNVGFKRKIGLIEQLTNKAKQLRVSLSQATNEKQVEQYNQKLEQTAKELTRLNALGRSVTANLGSVGNGFGRVTTQGKGAIGVTQEFNRVIQDAPFGLIGIGNNLQQLATNFGMLRSQAGSTGKAVGMALTSIVSPVNLGLLAISALTAGFTAYQMGAFDGIFATKDFTKSLEDFKETLSAVDSARLEGLNNADKELVTLSSLRGIIESETTSRKQKLDAVNQLQELYPAYFGNLTKEQILAGDLTKTYEALTKTILAKAQAEASVGKFVELADEERLILKKTAEERERISEFEVKALKNQIDGQTELQTINENQVRFLTSKIQPELDRVNEIIEEKKALEADITSNLIEANAVLTTQKTKVSDINKEYDEMLYRVELLNEIQSESGKKFLDLSKGLKVDGGDQVVDIPLDISIKPEVTGTVIGDFINQIKGQVESLDDFKNALVDAGVTSEEFFKGIESGAFKGLEQYDVFISKFMETNQMISDATAILEKGIENTIGDVAFAIGDALASGGNVLEAGGAALLGGLAVVLNQLGQLAIGTGVAMEAIKASFETLGGVGAIVAGVALVALAGAVSSKARSIGGGMRSGGGGASSGSSGVGGGNFSSGLPPQIFTNVNTVQPPAQTSPNYSGGSIDFNNAQSRMTVDIDGDKLKFIVDRADERKKAGG